MRALLAQRNARLYLGGQLVSLLGDRSMWLAMGIWARTLTGSNSAAGLVLFAFAAPQIFGRLSDLIVDRFKRRPLLIVTNVAIGVVVLSLTFVHGRSDIWIIYGVMVAYGVSYGIIGPAQSALLTTMLPDDLLPYGNSFLQMSQEGMRLVAPIAGAGLFVAVGRGA